MLDMLYYDDASIANTLLMLGRDRGFENESNDTTADSSDESSSEKDEPIAKVERNIGAYSPAARRKRIERFLEKRRHRVWTKKVDYGVRKNFADSRLRVKGRFMKKGDEEVLIQMMSLA